MHADAARSITADQRRQAIRWVYVNGFLWGLGSGLASVTLVVYLAMELGAAGMAIGVILATPRLVGVTRQFAPLLIDRFANRKAFCIRCFFVSAILLASVPVFARPGYLPSPGASLAVLAILYCGYRLFEYLAAVALWSWFGDLVPQLVRGRFVGCRESWVNAGRIIGMLVSGLLAWFFCQQLPRDVWWRVYAISAVLGAAAMLAALRPLRRIAPVDPVDGSRPRVTFDSLIGPFRDRRYWRLLVFGCWFSFFNGVTQTAQYIYPISILGLPLLLMLVLRIGMRSGQSAIAPWFGRLVDRIGNRPVLVVSQLIVATGPLFFLLATPKHWWIVVGAWVVWIAYAGLNVGLPNLMLKLSPEENNAPHIATYFAVSGLFFGVSTVVGGVAFDYLKTLPPAFCVGPWVFDHLGYLFYAGWVTRTIGVVFLLCLIEPGAKTWRDILADRLRLRRQ